MAFHKADTQDFQDIQNSNKLLLQRCANTLNRDCEFSSLEVDSYLMGWNDRYESHHYANLYWDAARMALFAAYPDLGKKFPVDEVDEEVLNSIIPFLPFPTNSML